ncbi:MFS transporter [Nitratireductor indicus]|uniref:Major facilitator superfamily (MFS) transporter n=1 Tax=Nitratireductor indicus C115 TaxID=1231190 RepID=K2N8U5_9HYPH|nr:MFS transporter [Nitratireductor indicus]EKF43923.1 Major facilitator superfamily (MFS) transporter [Nitratireductor indicus C115]MDS1135514.1 MFS transporter [Nitratireductor indicus]SFQ14160.1 Sugar phosphate permease [Nitratireductor indicus]
MAGIVALTVGYFLSQFYRSFLAVLTPALTQDLGATKADLSIASGAWFVVFALMQFVVGVSLDRYGPRKTASFLLVFGGAGGAVLFAAASNAWMVVLAMALNGIGCSAVLMAAVFIFAKSFSPARLAILISWLIAFGTMGNVISSAPMAAAAEAFGWRAVMAGLAVFTLLVGAAIYTLVRDPESDPEESGANSGFSGYIELLKLRVLWPILPLVIFNYAPSASIRGLWAGPFLADVYDADALLIGEVTLFMAIAMSVGSFLYGPLDMFFKTRKWVAFCGNMIALAALGLLALFPLAGIPAVTALLVVVGLCGASYGLMMSHGRAFVPSHLTGRGVTLLNFFSTGGVGVMQFATGGVVAATAVPGDPLASYRPLFLFYFVLLGLALAIYLFCRDAPPEVQARHRD